MQLENLPSGKDEVFMGLRPTLVGGHLQVRFSHRINGTHELSYPCQSSPDLQNWPPLPGTGVSALPSAMLPGFEEVPSAPNQPCPTTP